MIRCLTLAEKLRRHGAEVRFICREHVGHLCDLIEIKGYTVLRLPLVQEKQSLPADTAQSQWLRVSQQQDAAQTKRLLKKEAVDLLVIDHYAINEVWESILRETTKKIMVIDDLADRKHDCDFLLDQNDYDEYQLRYKSLVPAPCKTFLGPNFVLFRSEFYFPVKRRIRRGPVKRLLLFFGGSDQTNETKKALHAFLALNRTDIQIDLVVGQTNLHKKELAHICKQYDFLTFHYQVNYLAELMYKADLSIGAGGTTTWERCMMGLPSIVWSIADNQVKICENAGRKKIVAYLGKKEEVETSLVSKQLCSLLGNETARTEMSIRGYLLMKNNRLSQQMLVQEIMRVDE
ncbi:UDP-2,4-diacetamido-2,4,6-trideoxy-beta-L-altropyranose hydrolase [Peribacillus psychrosaccharolyticus]|uniref:UDP-2,4-diacetamido-2,4, 6-trideoxy-beta-L-altropyranose hydrolase n=1 Tax=Peribacillus psychrosaccharolyticus TaxID=1407 RepID=UPI002E1D0907|nr:UDP-2,4-diacetamido-2,4,6-trideoxy-beta-L-altropyranose hydrolase [Peribacillus psychrosaccharolyticus]MED3746323.1 UDP-2,4-diacetamido-2,4,6-trideoxy-beta-L-altropyranose hydrolase [Peribacillus psychrosaccharolyticus]